MEDSHRAQYERCGYTILRGVVPPTLLSRLNSVFSREVGNLIGPLASQCAEGPVATPYSRDGKYSPLAPPQVTNDGHRFRLEYANHDLHRGSRFWDQSYIDLVDLPGVFEAVCELATDESRWGHLGARSRGGDNPPRLSHHNIFLRPPWPSDAPPDTGGNLHGGFPPRGFAPGRDGVTISVAYELLDVGAGEGGFGGIMGSHHQGFALPTHEGWRQNFETAEGRGAQWPEHAEFRAVAPLSVGDALIFSERMTHGTLPWRAEGKERRTLFHKYTQHGKGPGNNCAYYDLADPRLSAQQRAILDGGVWGETGLQTHMLRLQALEKLRQDHRNQAADTERGGARL